MKYICNLCGNELKYYLCGNELKYYDVMYEGCYTYICNNHKNFNTKSGNLYITIFDNLLEQERSITIEYELIDYIIYLVNDKIDSSIIWNENKELYCFNGEQTENLLKSSRELKSKLESYINLL